MSRLHAITATASEIAARFEIAGPVDLAIPDETVEGLPGLVVMRKDGVRLLKSMTWPFPRPGLAARLGTEPGRIGLVADLTNPMREEMVKDPRYRCLIVLTHFANPDSDDGQKTRTWFSVKDQPIMAWAGFCRNMPEGGPVYAGMTMEANSAIPPCNDRMPALLEDGEWDEWLGGSICDVIRFQFRPPFDGARMVVQRTDDRWRSGARPPGAEPQLALI